MKSKNTSKKADLEKVLTPLIEKIVEKKLKSMLLEESGLLSKVITEVTTGLSMSNMRPSPSAVNSPAPIDFSPGKPRYSPPPEVFSEQKKILSEQEERKALRRKVLAGVAKDAYNGIDVFEGTRPLHEDEQKHEQGVNLDDLAKLGAFKF